MRKTLLLSIFVLCLSACVYSRIPAALPLSPQHTYVLPRLTEPAQVDTPALLATPTPTPPPVVAESTIDEFAIPNFEHIVLIVLENQYMQNVIGSGFMPNLNALAAQNVILSNYYAVAHPSLPNYLAMVSGSTQNITSDCIDCFVDQPNLADEVEASGRTWKAYLEDLPSPCFIGNKKPYVQIFNPFIYFNSIRLDENRCKRSIVPLDQLKIDLAAKALPNFVYIAPNLCNSGHDCDAQTADTWLGQIVAELQSSQALQMNSLIIITFDEGVQPAISVPTSGQVVTVLISPLARKNFVDATDYSHYSLLKTILTAWGLPQLGQTQLPTVKAINDPWLDQIGLAYPFQVTPTH